MDVAKNIGVLGSVIHPTIAIRAIGLVIGWDPHAVAPISGRIYCTDPSATGGVTNTNIVVTIAVPAVAAPDRMMRYITDMTIRIRGPFHVPMNLRTTVRMRFFQLPWKRHGTLGRHPTKQLTAESNHGIAIGDSSNFTRVSVLAPRNVSFWFLLTTANHSAFAMA